VSNTIEEHHRSELQKAEQRVLARYLRSAVEGNLEAWNELRRYFEAPLTILIAKRFYSLTPEDANDICSDCFHEARLALHSYEFNRSFWAWLSSFACKISIDELRRAGALKRTAEVVSLDALPAETQEPAREAIDASPTPDAVLVAKEDQEATQVMDRILYESLEELGADPDCRRMNCREILELHHFAELSLKDIGLQLRIPHGTVRSRCTRCAQKLNEIFQRNLSGSKPNFLAK
jgi:RNA polymerase sigma factor (sigma-70 family)